MTSADRELAATSKALDRAGVAVISSAMRECIADPEAAQDDAREFEKLFMMLA